MTISHSQTINLLYQSWESLKSAHDDLDNSKDKLEKAELEMETAMYLLENGHQEQKKTA